jgi:opacity protein-like surface antigen
MTKMKKLIKLTFASIVITSTVWAGNKDRSGQAGATELLLNPNSRTAGMFGLNGAHVIGAEALKLNTAGLAKVTKTEVNLAHTRYLAGTGMSMSNLGLATKINDHNVLGVNIMSFGFGEIPLTTETLNEGELGTYKPSFLNVTLALGHKFTEHMSAGAGLTYVNEAISNIRASALAFDAGVQYVNGKRDNFHLGITLRNVGSNVRFGGDGFSFSSISPDLAKDITVQSRSEKAALPSQLNLCVSYDYYLDEKKTKDKSTMPLHRLTPMFSFISNSFSADWVGLGCEYAYKEKFMARFGYRYEGGIMDKENTATNFVGLAAGVSFVTKFSKAENAPDMAIDYGYKPTRFSAGVHTVGIRLALNGKDKDEEKENK